MPLHCFRSIQFLDTTGFDQLVVSLDLRFYRQLLCLNSARGKTNKR